MIGSKTHAVEYCRDDIRTIENYEFAVSDTEHVWQCHHRLELEVLPDGRVIRRTVAQLKACNHYYSRPACELIFLREDEHKKLHMHGNDFFKGKKHSDGSRKALSDKMKGRKVTWGDKISAAKRGKKATRSK